MYDLGGVGACGNVENTAQTSSDISSNDPSDNTTTTTAAQTETPTSSFKAKVIEVSATYLWVRSDEFYVTLPEGVSADDFIVVTEIFDDSFVIMGTTEGYEHKFTVMKPTGDLEVDDKISVRYQFRGEYTETNPMTIGEDAEVFV